MRRRKALPAEVTIVPPHDMTVEQFDDAVAKAIRDVAEASREREAEIWAMSDDIIRRSRSALLDRLSNMHDTPRSD